MAHVAKTRRKFRKKDKSRNRKKDKSRNRKNTKKIGGVLSSIREYVGPEVIGSVIKPSS